MPNSAVDRCSTSHEHVYFFTKNEKYYFKQFLVPTVTASSSPRKFGGNKQASGGYSNPTYSGNLYIPEMSNMKNMRDVWWISTKRSEYDHCATYPEELVKPILEMGCPKQICTKCGLPRELIVETSTLGKSWHDHASDMEEGQSQAHGEMSEFYAKGKYDREATGWSDCGCGADFKPGMVFDPFTGTGTSLVVAKKMGLSFSGSDVNLEYVNMATDRLEKTRVERASGASLW